jgi:hypothetical protein
MKKIRIEDPPTHSDEDVEEGFAAFQAKHPEIVEKWIRIEAIRSDERLDIRDIHIAVYSFLKSQYEWTTDTALAHFWVDMRRVVHRLALSKSRSN